MLDFHLAPSDMKPAATPAIGAEPWGVTPAIATGIEKVLARIDATDEKSRRRVLELERGSRQRTVEFEQRFDEKQGHAMQKLKAIESLTGAAITKGQLAESRNEELRSSISRCERLLEECRGEATRSPPGVASVPMHAPAFSSYGQRACAGRVSRTLRAPRPALPEGVGTSDKRVPVEGDDVFSAEERHSCGESVAQDPSGEVEAFSVARAGISDQGAGRDLNSPNSEFQTSAIAIDECKQHPKSQSEIPGFRAGDGTHGTRDEGADERSVRRTDGPDLAVLLSLPTAGRNFSRKDPNRPLTARQQRHRDKFGADKS